VTVRRLSAANPLAPSDLEDHPELAILTVVSDATVVLDLALVAAHPHVAGDCFSGPLEDAANVILQAGAALRAAIAAYRGILDHEAEGRQ
jgi:hypothetical protein